MRITRKEAQAPFGDSARALSIFLGIDHTTVAHWDCNTPIPALHQWRLATALPEYFVRENARMREINDESLHLAYAYMERFGIQALPPPTGPCTLTGPALFQNENDTDEPSDTTYPDGSNDDADRSPA